MDRERVNEQKERVDGERERVDGQRDREIDRHREGSKKG